MVHTVVDPVLCRCMGKDGGIAFYNGNPKRAMLFWTFAGACMSSLYSVNLPTFERTDTINPEFEDSRNTWCATQLIAWCILALCIVSWQLELISDRTQRFAALCMGLHVLHFDTDTPSVRVVIEKV